MNPLQQQLQLAAAQLASNETEIRSLRQTIDMLAGENSQLKLQVEQLQLQLNQTAEPPSE